MKIDKKYFYVRITKCACQTIYNLYRNDKNFVNFYSSTGQTLSRSPIDKALLLTEKDFIHHKKNNLITFGFLRNPYDRAVSSFTYSKMNNWIDKEMSFYNFLSQLPFLFREESRKLNKQQLLIKRHAFPQTAWLTDEEGPVVDFLGRIEFIKDHVKKLDDILNVKKNRNICHINPSRPRTVPYTSYYSKKEKDLVDSLYKEDINRFGYSYNNDDPNHYFVGRNY